MLEIDEAVGRLATAPRLLVCTDFDGTICELGPDAYAVTPDPRALAALSALAGMADTTVTVLSGRHVEGLRQVCPLEPPVVFVGSHGAESSGHVAALSPELKAQLADIERRLEAITSGNEPAFVEAKPFSRVLHVAALAEVDPTRAQMLIDEAYGLSRALPEGVSVTPGHNIMEFSVAKATKGSWLAEAKRAYDSAVFVGDDVTDETAFAVLGPHDVGIKVGVGETAAGMRLPDVDAVAAFFSALAATRGR
ncbi:trehalose-phosphatase [Corynebacterium aquatimens]|uniref:Trehalose 6-phosphate phosphatase n=1 Tax=Corynebacterium aquatimens TaxID=1190508 RepID=A0A931E1Z1_9CORY|nr:trehalose-phosphatase [Corynebacterium aquatimens]MBG6122316.1 trehalose 6-phosphate phosphatase [Corynebacterium aquatimens]WJY65142.1 Trehalose-6-phosphate phosphatase [Corynebacterium aquatimens]